MPPDSASTQSSRATLRRERMSTVDTAWLRMDSEANLMMIVSVLMFDKPLAMPRFLDTMQARFLPYRRFRSRVTQDVTGAWWQEQDIDLDQHILHTRLADGAPHNKAALETLVSELSSTALDPDLPLWQMHIVDNCAGEDGRVRQAVIIRIHHCIADGIALVGVLLSMFDAQAEGHERPPSQRETEEAEENAWMQLLQPVTRTAVSAINMSASVLAKYVAVMSQPEEAAAKFARAGQVTSQVAIDSVKLLTMREDTRTRLKGIPKGKKVVAWSEPLPLAEIKVVGKVFGASINDVLMSSVAGAIGAFLRAEGDTVADDAELRAMVPVNLRKSGREQKLGNAFGLVPLVLPIGIADPLLRLEEVRQRMGELKKGYQALLAMAILGVLGTTPKQVQTEIQNYFGKKATAVMSNVPGPAAPLYLAGSQLDQIMFWVPQSGDIGVGVSILSYNGGVQFGIVTDDAIVMDPHEIIRRFQPEFEKLVMLALMAEWS